MTKVWGTQVIVGDRTIDVHVRKLEKIGENISKQLKGRIKSKCQEKIN